jgi:hypothetical protein
MPQRRTVKELPREPGVIVAGAGRAVMIRSRGRHGLWASAPASHLPACTERIRFAVALLGSVARGLQNVTFRNIAQLTQRPCCPYTAPLSGTPPRRGHARTAGAILFWSMNNGINGTDGTPRTVFHSVQFCSTPAAASGP